MVSRKRVFDLLRTINVASCQCPAHSHTGNFQVIHSTPSKDYAFEIKCSTVRYGLGVTKEVGQDLVNLGAKNVCVMTDPNVVSLSPMKAVVDSLSRNGVNYKVYDSVKVEPSDSSFKDAIKFAKEGEFDSFVAIGGGSVMDTCKAANLYYCDSNAEFLDYVNQPVGKGKAVTVPLKPLIAIPTTSGTGSETTGLSIFDYEEINAKTGISHIAMRPTLALIDPLHTLTVPKNVAIYAGFDIFVMPLKALQLYHIQKEDLFQKILHFVLFIKEAIQYQMFGHAFVCRCQCPAHSHTGNFQVIHSTPSKDYAFEALHKYFNRSVNNSDDIEARSSMHLAATMAGVGIGNAGVHLCHGLAYPIAGNVKEYVPEDYGTDPIIPHGLAVTVTAPAVFRFTAASDPDKHLEAAKLLGADITGKKQADAGKVLSDTILGYMDNFGIGNGLSSLGYSIEDIPKLVKGALPQHRLLQIAPVPQSEEDLSKLLEDSLTVY